MTNEEILAKPLAEQQALFPSLPQWQRSTIWTAAFWDSLHPDYAIINPTHNPETANTEQARIVSAAKLVSLGHPVDEGLMIWAGLSPYYWVIVRRNNMQDTSPYDPAVLPEPFKVEPPPLVDHRYVGDAVEWFPGHWNCLPDGLPLLKGTVVSQDGVRYRKIVQRGLMGETHWWELA